ncbi:MAG TPA: 2-phospho-L-lactate guanylyltransferase [Ktedonobacteraceae bacterium]|jgi:2-phospho-L-lactate guanylyltransferase|nr:2-phospho-L-lactate guanylyltransferase [Ktedonobacteraceae bacterium]
MKYTALIPVKSLALAKSRLAPSLSQRERETLVLDMLQHVLHTLRQSECFEDISVVSADARVLSQAEQWGASALPEERDGHNPALEAAARRELAAGASALLTISADLPLLTVCDIRTLVKQSAQYEVVLAVSREGTGTNAVLVRPPLALPYLFGPNSLQLHRQAAIQGNLHYLIYKSHGLAMDIDTIDDLHEIQDTGCNCQQATYAKLATPNL